MLHNATMDRQHKTFTEWMHADQGAAHMTLELVRAECTVPKGN